MILKEYGFDLLVREGDPEHWFLKSSKNYYYELYLINHFCH